MGGGGGGGLLLHVSHQQDEIGQIRSSSSNVVENSPRSKRVKLAGELLFVGPRKHFTPQPNQQLQPQPPQSSPPPSTSSSSGIHTKARGGSRIRYFSVQRGNQQSSSVTAVTGTLTDDRSNKDLKRYRVNSNSVSIRGNHHLPLGDKPPPQLQLSNETQPVHDFAKKRSSVHSISERISIGVGGRNRNSSHQRLRSRIISMQDSSSANQSDLLKSIKDATKSRGRNCRSTIRGGESTTTAMFNITTNFKPVAAAVSASLDHESGVPNDATYNTRFSNNIRCSSRINQLHAAAAAANVQEEDNDHNADLHARVLSDGETGAGEEDKHHHFNTGRKQKEKKKKKNDNFLTTKPTESSSPQIIQTTLPLPNNRRPKR